MLYAVLTGALARLLLAWSGIGQLLSWRVEVSTAANSNLELREGLTLYALGVSPYSGSSCRIPPLALWLYSCLAHHDLLYVLPNILLDTLAALLLHRTATHLISTTTAASASPATGSPSSKPHRPEPHQKIPAKALTWLPPLLAWGYLLNPFTLAAAAGGTISPLEGVAVIAVLYGSCVRRPVLAAAGLAAAMYCSLHAVVLLLPAACILSYGPEDVMLPSLPSRPVSQKQQQGPLSPASSSRKEAAGEGDDVGEVGGPATSPPDHPDAATASPRAAEATEPQAKGQNSTGVQEIGDKGHEAATGTAATATESRVTGSDSVPAPPPTAPHSNAAAGGAATTACTAPTAPRSVDPVRQHLLPWGSLGRCGVLLLGWLLLGAALSDLWLMLGPQPLAASPFAEMNVPTGGAATAVSSGGPCMVPVVQHVLLHAGLTVRHSPALLKGGSTSSQGASGAAVGEGAGAVLSTASPSSVSVGAGGPPLAVRQLAAAVLTGLQHCWAVRVYGSQVLLDDVTPNVGQWWYLGMETFQDTKVYVRLLAHSLLLALTPALAMRLGPRSPLALFQIQLLSLALLKPYPSIADLGLAASLLPLTSRRQLAAPPLPMFLPASLLQLVALGPAMLHMWLAYESANSNFFYSVTLLYGVWQVALLGQVLYGTLTLDRAARGKGIDRRV